MQNAGKSSRAGTRAARIVRIVRLVRLMRIAKLYKHARNAIQSDSIEKIADEEDLQIPKESRVGKKLSDIITKRVIVLVMIMLLIIPLFDLDFFKIPETGWDYGLNAIDDYGQTEGNTTDAILFYQDYFQNSSRPLIYIKLLSGYQ